MRKGGPFLALAAAETLSLSGTRLSTIAIPWLVLSATGSPVLTGLTAMMEMLPYVAAKALSGPLIDRVGPKRIAVVCDTASVAVVMLVPLLDWLGLLDMSLLLPVVFAMGVLRGPSDAAKQAMVPDIAELAAVPLERVTGLVGAIERLASTAGAAGAGALIGLIGPGQALVVNAVTFAAAALIVGVGIPGLRRVPELRCMPEARPGGMSSYLGDLREGWRFLRGDAVLVSIVIMVATTNLLDQAYHAVLLPVWTRSSGHGPELLGAMFSAFTGASIAGAAIAAAIGERMPRLMVYTVAFLLTGFPRFLVIALDAPLPIIFLTLAIAGFASGFLNPILSAVIFERIPKPLTGRVTAMNAALCFALIPFGGLVGGALISTIGLAAALSLTGLAYLAATLFPLALKSFRGFDKPITQT
ncbi:MFS transporter [Rhizobium leguminosarum]|uniref:Major facilitator superfamily MFS_1 n=1 Tax=Rhizobium leguminosarum bv. trifolii (strain WSM1325) TaxID=395491 RepID=C6B3Z3_RHILS|nr:MFS transporter [Rhizobium leguminosarum]ACS56944.1 major facilitator superfamily MFS_1 [Rhizobium leguminosarum bv. trifolii WSM1325]MBY2912067.1 MFS transporter [Rhizobium leguminosarum]MBY2925914.1 MFS transporter [Rhizobium leguminosarum]MBY2952001.1 MFS transporter [Rhizobium leguminosarum]MBY2996680.1 MFS transporter [Rhizobium leguminosarum]